MAVEALAPEQRQHSQYIDFWNSVLVPKFVRWKHILVDGYDAVGFQLAIGPAGEVYREAGKLAEELHDEIAAALSTQLAKHKGHGGVMMDSSSWKVTARNPG